MRVTLLGTRGSMPAPGRRPRATAATRRASRCAATTARCWCSTPAPASAGSGRSCRRIRRIDILLTHLHMDHIQGLGFFAPLYNPGIEVHIWGPASSTLPLDAACRATSRRRCSRSTCAICRASPATRCPGRPSRSAVPDRTALVCHPDPTVGYRIEEEGRTPPTCPTTSPRWAPAGRWRPNGPRATRSRTAPIC